MSAHSVSLFRASRAADEGLSLLLDLFAVPPSADAPAPRPAGSTRAEVRARVRQCVRWAAGWGAGPDGAWRAW